MTLLLLHLRTSVLLKSFKILGCRNWKAIAQVMMSIQIFNSSFNSLFREGKSNWNIKLSLVILSSVLRSNFLWINKYRFTILLACLFIETECMTLFMYSPYDTKLTNIANKPVMLEGIENSGMPEDKININTRCGEWNLDSSSESEAVLPTILAQHEFHLHIPLNVLSTLQKFHIKRCPDMQLCGSKGFGGFTSLTKLKILQNAPCCFPLLMADFSLPSLIPELRIQGLPKKLQPYFPWNRTFLKELVVKVSPDL